MALTSGTRHLLREAASWAVVAIVGVIAIVHFDDLKVGIEKVLGLPTPADVETAQQMAVEQAPPPHSGSVVEISAGRNGHFQTDAEVNGRSIEFLVDTGATMVALSYEDADRVGIRLNPSDFTRAVTTANGTARVAAVTLDRVSIGDITVRDVPAAVSEPGRLKTSLLGMTFLSRLSRFDMRSGMLVLQD